MPKKGQAAAKANSWPPAISDEKVKAATGRNWMGWLVILNRASANAMPHKEIARLLGEKYGVPSWWRQMIAVEYERARGGRAKHERPDGYSVSITKVIPVSLPKLFAATTDPKLRAKWFPKGAFEETSKTKDNTGAANGRRTRGWKSASTRKARARRRSRCNRASWGALMRWRKSAPHGRRRSKSYHVSS